MTTPTNPFADDPPPLGAVRLQSAADPLDPYAAPAAIAEDQRHDVASATPEIGLWRQGRYLVMHYTAPFPARCVLTNAPTDELVSRSIPRGYVIDLGWQERLSVRYAISPGALRWLILIRLFSIGSFLLIVYSVLQFARVTYASWSFLYQMGYAIFLAIPMLVLMILALGLCKMAVDATRPLRVVSIDGEFRWLINAGPNFLNSLPQWPGKPRQRLL